MLCLHTTSVENRYWIASPGLTPLSSPSYGHSSNDSSDNISLG
ncbi:2153_t:CDS:1, partial [Funneliformis caledonium]